MDVVGIDFAYMVKLDHLSRIRSLFDGTDIGIHQRIDAWRRI